MGAYVLGELLHFLLNSQSIKPRAIHVNEPSINPHPVSAATSLVDRVLLSLNRLGYYHIQAEDLGGGKVRLSGTIPSHDERAVVVAAARTVAGVTSISLKLRV
ncbi:MAG: BON domain-containing protein [Rubripirellula sp.]